MRISPSLKEEYSRLALRWLSEKAASNLRIHTDTTDFFKVEYGDIVLLNQSTVVVGRKGVSRQEEFLFGSVSSKIVKKAKGCTVWVVE